MLYESVSPDVAKIIVQHVVKAEELVQPKLRLEEGQAPSFLELAERLATVVRAEGRRREKVCALPSTQFPLLPSPGQAAAQGASTVRHRGGAGQRIACTGRDGQGHAATA